MARNNPETRLHIAILHFLLAVLPKAAADTLIHVPNGEKRSPITGALLKRMGVRPGVEDLQFIWSNDRAGSPLYAYFYAIEVKPEGRYQSAVQKDRQRAVLAAGGRYAVCRSTDDVRETLAQWCIPTREVATA